jgi:MFS family permease
MGWELLMVPMLFFWGSIFFAFAILIGWLRVPRWLLGLSAGILCGLLSLVATAAAGWYIDIAAFPAYGAGVLGLLFGCFILPRFAPQGGTKWPAWVRTIGATAAVLGLGLSIIYPILPERDSQELEVVFVRLVPEEEQIATGTDKLSADEIKLLRSLGLKGSLRVGMQASKSTGNSSRHARAIIVLRERLETRVDLREPKATNVVYVQDGKNWNMYPPGARTIGKKISFWPDELNPTDLEVELEPRMSTSSSFSRYAPLNER